MRNVGWSLIFFQLNTYIDLQTQEVDDDIDIDIDIDQDSRHRHSYPILFYPILFYPILVNNSPLPTLHHLHHLHLDHRIRTIWETSTVQDRTKQDKTGSLAVSSTPLTNY